MDARRCVLQFNPVTREIKRPLVYTTGTSSLLHDLVLKVRLQIPKSLQGRFRAAAVQRVRFRDSGSGGVGFRTSVVRCRFKTSKGELPAKK